MGREEPSELAVVVPVLNEAATLPLLLETLTAQRRVALELVVCDGGSDDGTPALARKLAGNSQFPVTVITAKGGRGAQLNAGAAASRAPTLLFLHADSRFDAPLALRTGLDSLAAASTARGHDRLAGRFRLRFDRSDPRPAFGYYFYEWKARLDRRECIHGDQGFLLSRSFFESAGPFPEVFPMLAETRFAEAVRQRGEWLLLPTELRTSARRFEVEGLRARQTLNAIIMNFANLELQQFFQAIPRLYPYQDRSRPLRLLPILQGIASLIGTLSLRQRLSLWYRTGAYVRANGWQLAFALDARLSFRRGLPVGAGKTPLLTLYDRWLDVLTDHPPGRLLAAGLVWLWLRWRLQFVGRGETMEEQ